MKMKTSPFAILAVLSLGLWLIFDPVERLFSPPAAPPRTVTPRGDLASDEKNTIEIFKENSPAVVYVTSIALRRDFFSLNAVEIPQGTGSGFVWDSQGRIVTNYHVISDASRVKVTMADQSTWKAALVGAAPDQDIAVLQIDAPPSRLHPIGIGSSADLIVGQKVFAIGNPFGLDQTLTTGIISALNREIKGVTGRIIRGSIQTDAAINPGNSGGPLLDSAGRLIGINTAIYSPSGAYAGIGFAVPVDTVNTIVPQLIQHGRVIRSGLGVVCADERIARRLGVEGVLILQVQKDGPAYEAGLRPTREYRGEIIWGDIITHINDTRVSSYDDLRDELDSLKVGSTVALTLLRGGQTARIQVRLGMVE